MTTPAVSFEGEDCSSESIPFGSLLPCSPDDSENKTAASDHIKQDTFRPAFLFHSVLRVSNISWDTSIEDMVQFFERFNVKAPQVHIPIDRLTGKTKSDLYVEMGEIEASLTAIQFLNRKILKGRSLSLGLAWHTELYKVHFCDEYDPSGLGISKNEATSLINICRNYKIYFSRKCAERPFEHVISLLRLVEWYRLRPAGRDRLFQLTLASLEALQGHFGKPLCQISPSLLKRLYEAAKSFPAFTPGQQSQLDWCLDTTIFDIAHSEASSQELYNFHELQTDSIRHILGSTSWKVWKKLGQTGDANDGYSEEDETLYEMRRNFDLIFGKDSVISTTNVQSIF